MPLYASPQLDGYDGSEDVIVCRYCGEQVIFNYDGLGTGWSHMFEGANYLRTGTKECFPQNANLGAIPPYLEGK